MQQLVSIDGDFYNVAVTSVKRTHNITDGDNAGRSAAPDGVMIRDVIGTYMQYVVSFEQKGDDHADYAAMINALSQPVDFVTMELPYDQGLLEFDAYVSKVEDELQLNLDGVLRWGGCSVTFTAKAPLWRP